MRVLMTGVDRQTKGGMWTVVENYLHDKTFEKNVDLIYVATSITGSVPKRIAFTAKALMRVLFVLMTKSCDIVHVHMAERGSVYRKNIVLCMARIFHSKTVIHMHGAEFEDWYKAQSEKKQAGIRKILNKADKVLILGKYWEDFIAGMMEDKSKIQVLYNAVEVPEKNSYNCDAANMLFLGVVGQRKGVYDLLQAVKQADEKLPKNVQLMIYGPNYEGRIESVIFELNLSDRVKYMGWLTEDKKPEVFGNTAVNILPSYNEGLPMTILETMAAGIPNISTNVAAIPEAVNEDNGVIITPGDINHLVSAVTQLMNDREIRQKKSSAAYDYTKKYFSLENHIQQLLCVYEGLKNKNA